MTTRLLLEIVGENRYDFEMKLEDALAKLGYEKRNERIDFWLSLEFALHDMGYNVDVLVNDYRIKMMKQRNETIIAEKAK